jgi:hypothetical protein
MFYCIIKLGKLVPASTKLAGCFFHKLNYHLKKYTFIHHYKIAIMSTTVFTLTKFKNMSNDCILLYIQLFCKKFNIEDSENFKHQFEAILKIASPEFEIQLSLFLCSFLKNSQINEFIEFINSFENE